MTRRGLLGFFGTAALCAADPERLLWVPGKKVISIPAPKKHLVVVDFPPAYCTFSYWVEEEYLRKLSVADMRGIATVLKQEMERGINCNQKLVNQYLWTPMTPEGSRERIYANYNFA